MRSCIRSIIGLFLLAVQPAFSAGTIPVALVQQFNANGVPLAGCLLYLYVTGTVATPQLAYQDTGLTTALPWPVQCDANGRLPMFYVADGSIHPRLTDSSGIVQFDYPSMLVIGPSGGSGGGGGTIDPTTIATTGDVKFRPTAESLTGWVKLNGQTIGSATSGASQRANADTQSLFVYLWTNCPNSICPVSTGRGANALADFNANKTITLLDARGRSFFGLCDMGSTDSARFANATFTTGDCLTAQSVGGTAAQTIGQTNLPSYNLSLTSVTVSGTASVPGATLGPGGGTTLLYPANQGSTFTVSAPVSGTLGGTLPSGGSGTALSNVPPFMFGTYYMKL